MMENPTESANTQDGATPSLPSNSSMQDFALATFTSEEVSKLPEINFATYMKLVEPLAMEVQAKTGIRYLVPIIQSAHESRSGNSGLARQHCNLFGIVATETWKKNGNPVANMPTFEYINGHKVEMKREFREYKTWRDSFFDWARLLTDLNIYKKAYQLLKANETVIEGIAEMGKIYATDPNYTKALVSLYKQVA